MTTVKALAIQFNVTTDTIRHYTKIGLLSPDRDKSNGYRHYTQKDIKRLRFLLSAKRLGFTLNDIRKFMEVADSGNAPCSLVRELIRNHLNIIRQDILDAKILYERMEHASRLWEQMPDQIPTGDSICHLIENWETPVSIKSPTNKRSEREMNE